MTPYHTEKQKSLGESFQRTALRKCSVWNSKRNMLNAFLWNRKIKFNVKVRISFKKREQIVLWSNKRRNRNIKTKKKKNSEGSKWFMVQWASCMLVRINFNRLVMVWTACIPWIYRGSRSSYARSNTLTCMHTYSTCMHACMPGPTQAFCHLFSICSCSLSAPLHWLKSLVGMLSSSAKQQQPWCSHHSTS